MSHHFTRFVFLDGIFVPTQGVQCTWSEEGMMQASIQLNPSYAAERILASTHVHIFAASSVARTMRRRVVDLEDADDDSRLRAAESRETLGESWVPSLNLGDLESPGLGHRAYPPHCIHYRFGGEVVALNVSESSGSAPQVTLICQGYDGLLDMINAIQLTRGYGTLAEEERSFFGQQDGVFDGRGRNAFFDGVVNLISDSPEGLPQAIRRLITRYPARINKMWLNRFPWTRLADQVVAIDTDPTVGRLLGTRAFRDYLKQVLQQLYTVPLRALAVEMLKIPQHRLVAIPSPAFFPLYAEQEREEIRDEEPARSHGGSWEVRVTVPSLRLPAPPEGSEDPLDPNYGGGYVRVAMDAGNGIGLLWERTDGTRVPVGIRTLRGGRLTGSLVRETVESTSMGASYQVNFTIPEGWTGGQSAYTYLIPFPLVRGSETPLVYAETIDFANASSDADQILEIPEVTLSIEVYWRARVETETEDTPPVEEESPREAGPLSSRFARLGSYAILPRLWWACPPACNILIPEHISNALTYTDPVAAKPTRLMGKISPGRSGSSRVLIDTFSAPSAQQLNRGLRGDGESPDDPRDPETLYRPEYFFGPKAEVNWFENLHRLVRDEEWETYLKTYLNLDFWDRRIGAVRGSVTLHGDIRVVTGAPILIIRSAPRGRVEDPQTPEQRHWLRRQTRLETLRRQLNACRRRFGSGTSLATSLRRHLQALYAARAWIENFPGTLAGSISNVDNAARTFGFRSAIRSITTFDPSGPGDPLGYLRGTTTYSLPASQLLGGGDGGFVVYEFTAETIQRLLPDEPAALELLTTTAALGASGRWPTSAELRRWFDNVGANLPDHSACLSALARDLERVDAALAETRSRLRELGHSGGDGARAILAHVVSATDSTSSRGASTTLELSHIRPLGGDLDWDGLAGDDPEALIAFSENGFVDERYACPRIGTEVYKPVYGCGSVADTEEARDYLERRDEEGGDGEIDGLPPVDAGDIVSAFEHPDVCGHSCAEEADAAGPDAGMNTTSACLAIVARYQELVAAGADADARLEWAESLRVRSSLTLADAYRTMPLVFGDDEISATSERQSFAASDAEVYPDGRVLRGFFAASFLAGDMDFDRMTVVSRADDGEFTPVGITDDEKDLLQARTGRVLAYVEELRDKTTGAGT